MSVLPYAFTREELQALAGEADTLSSLKDWFSASLEEDGEADLPYVAAAKPWNM